MAAENFNGKWKFDSSDNFDEYMKQVGIGFITRKAAEAVKPQLEFEVAGDQWKMTSTSTFTTWKCEFELGKEIEEKTADGRVLKAVFTFENGKLIEKQTKIKPDDHDSYFERYIDADGKLVITMECEGVKAKRVYTKA